MAKRMRMSRDRKIFRKTANRSHKMNLRNPLRGQSKI